MHRQLEVCQRRLLTGSVHGVVICSNCVLGLGIESEQIVKEWIAAAGDLELPEKTVAQP